jgi:hypothetical protein
VPSRLGKIALHQVFLIREIKSILLSPGHLMTSLFGFVIVFSYIIDLHHSFNLHASLSSLKSNNI